MNKRLEEVTYRTYDPQPVLQQSIVPLEKDDGDMLRRVASGLARVADTLFERGAREAAFAGEQAGMRDALASAPGASTIEGGDPVYAPPKGLRVQVAPSDVKSAIAAAAQRNGVPEDDLTQIAWVESKFDPNARNPGSSAGGLFQFTDPTARAYKLANKFDAVASSEAAARLYSDNKRALEGRLGRQVNLGELYLAHQQGAKGASDLLSNPDKLAIDVVGRDAVLKNGGDETMTAAQFASRWTSKFNTSTVRADQRRENTPFDLVMADGSKPDVEGVKPAVLTAFQDLQNAWGKSIPIRSGYRDPERNRKAGGADKSQHIHGNALDLDVSAMNEDERKDLIRTASALGFKGIGVYQNSVHLDMGARRAWGPSHHDDSIPGWAQDVIGEHMTEKATSDRASRYQDTSDDDGPLEVKRVPLSITTKPGRWQPTRSNTIYGRAYDVAGTRTYLQMAKLGIIEDQAAVYDKYKDDPVQLRSAMDQMLEAHRRDGTMLPEIAPEYELSFRQNALGYIQQAQSNAEKLKLQQDNASFNDRLTGLEDRKSQLLVGVDPRDPQASTMLDDMQGTIDSHYDSAVARGMMTPDKAREAKRLSRSETMSGFYLKQANGLKADEIDALAVKMADDYAAGNLKGVTPEDWGRIQQGLQAAKSHREAEDNKATADLSKRGDDMFTRALRGEPVAPSEVTKFRTDVRLAPDGENVLASTEARLKLASALRTQPIGTVEKNLGEILKRPGGTVNAADTEFARGQIDEVRKKLMVDPLGQAESFGLIPPVPPITIDGMKDPAALRDALSARWGSATAAAKHFGVPVKYFRPGGADQLQAAAMANPDAMVAFTLNVANSFGKDTPAAMREISEQGPIMAHAVGLSITTGDASLARDVAKISVMKANKELAVKLPEGDQLGIKANEFLGGALMAQPEMQSAAVGTAKLLFEKMAFEQGFDPATIKEPGSVAAAAWEKALDRALGGQVMNGDEYGGLGSYNDRPIVVPAFMKKDQVESVFYGMTETQLAKLAPRGTINGIDVTAGQMKDGYLVSVGDGLYRVAINDPASDDPAYVIDKAGKPWVLDINALDKIQKTPNPATDGEATPMAPWLNLFGGQ